MIGYEFDDPTPSHKCDILDTRKISNSRTHLICIICKKVVAEWDDIPNQTKKIWPDISNYSEATLKEYT